MAHIVVCDEKSHELEKILNGNKTMLIRGGEGRKIPHSRVFEQDELFFTEKGSNTIVCRATVSNVVNYVRLHENEIVEIIEDNKDKLQLSSKQEKKFHKKCLCLIEFVDIEKIPEIKIKPISNLVDWLIVEEVKDLLSKE